MKKSKYLTMWNLLNTFFFVDLCNSIQIIHSNNIEEEHFDMGKI